MQRCEVLLCSDSSVKSKISVALIRFLYKMSLKFEKNIHLSVDDRSENKRKNIIFLRLHVMRNIKKFLK